MAIQYDWHISRLDAKINQDEKSNVIYYVHWVLKGWDDSEIDTNENPVYQKTIGGGCKLDAPTDSFIEYDNLTKENVVSWLENKLDVDELKQEIANKINQQKNPTDVFLTPNWNN